MEQDIRFCRTSDEIRIAYAVTGSGYPLVLVPGWVSHLELMWEMELTRTSYEALSRNFTLIRLDKRGTGLSQRGVTDFSWDARARDVEAVARHAGLERFALYAISEGCTGALQFAADHPEQVSHLILQGAAAPNAHTADLLNGVVSVIKAEWGLGSKLMSDVLLGENAPPELERWFARLQREGATADEAAAMMAANITPPPDAAAMVGRITSPTLLINGREDNVAPPEDARILAAFLHARYMSVDGGHVPNAEQFEVIRAAIVDFVIGLRPASKAPAGEKRETPAVGAPAAMAVILFTDIADSTGLTERMGDAAFRAASRALDEALRRAIVDAGGTAIDGKLLGDGVMAVFTSAREAIDAASRCQTLSADSELRLHLGLHAGDVIREGANVYGGAVNIASRICALSAPGEILVSEVVRGMARTSSDVVFEDRGEQEMKGVADAQRVFAVRPS